MNIRSKKADVTIDALIVTIPENEIKSIVSVLVAVKKRAKPDRLDEFILNKLIYALEHPEVDGGNCSYSTSCKATSTSTITSSEKSPIAPKTHIAIDKKQVIEQVKQRVDPRGEKNLQTFITESIEFAHKSIGVKVVPKDASIESFYDFLVESKIINVDGTPVTR